MADWGVSRHPEWDMMYAAGLTVREIATWCHQHDNTVRLHLQVREGYWPGFRAAHEEALAARGPDRPTTGWRRRHSEAAAFVAEHGRLPDPGTCGERSLAAWITVQRLAYLRGELGARKIILMGELTGWNLSPHQARLDENWRQRFAELIDFVATNGRVPRWRNHQSEHERVLGVWLHKQHQARSEGTIPRWRHEALDAALPGWKSRT